MWDVLSDESDKGKKKKKKVKKSLSSGHFQTNYVLLIFKWNPAPSASCLCPYPIFIVILQRRPLIVPLPRPHICPPLLLSSPLLAMLCYCTCPAQSLVENYLADLQCDIRQP